VAKAILGEAPVSIPAEYYTGYDIKNDRIEGAKVRETEPVSILFKHDTDMNRVPDYRRYGGDDQPDEETIFVRLREGDIVRYEFTSKKGKHDIKINSRVIDKGNLRISISSRTGSKSIDIEPLADWMEVDCFLGELLEGEVTLTVSATGSVDLETIRIY
jgi:hypothetical protein